MLAAFHAMYVRVGMVVFFSAQEDMTFAALVPLFSAYLAWEDRGNLAKAAAGPSIWGFAACVPLLFASFLGSRGEQMRLEQLGFIGLVVALPWAFYGWKCARRLAFPAAYLLFTIPLASFLDFVTVKLRLFAVATAIAVLNGFGLDAAQQGTAIISNGAMPFSIDVAEPCSGLRSLFALSALTVAYARLYQPTWPRRIALMLCAAPLAVAGNVARIISICLVSAVCGKEFGTGFYHDYSGYIVFIAAILLMLAASGLIDKIAAGRAPKAERTETKPEAAEVEHGGESADTRSGNRTRWIFVALLLPVLFFQATTPAPEIADELKCRLPDALAGYAVDDVLSCQEEQCAKAWTLAELAGNDRCPACGGELDGMSLAERLILPPDTRIVKKVYSSAFGERYFVSMVYGGKTRASLHRPEMCLPSQGNLMRDKRNLETRVPFHAIGYSNRRGNAVLAYTFFNQENYRTASHTARIFRDVLDRSLRNRIDRWAMVTVATYSAGELADPHFRARLGHFLDTLAEAVE